jgi:DNA replication protein DnaC
LTKAKDQVCPKCGGSTWLPGDDGEAVPCDCRDRRLQQARTRGLASTIPAKYRGIAIAPDGQTITDAGRPMHFAPEVARSVLRFCRDINANLDSGRGLWLEGDTGTGKTTLAMLVSKAALDAGRSVAIYSMPKLLAEIRGTFDSDNDDSYAKLRARLAAVDLLHLDDVGAEQQTEWVLEQLYSIVNERYEDGRSIMITTNLTIDQLREQVGDRTVSRLAETCDQYPLFGPDRRREFVPEDQAIAGGEPEIHIEATKG